MNKKVVLAEKPSVARDIARILKCSKKGEGFLEGNEYIVTWALGHLVELGAPEKYDEKYKSWNMEDLPMIPPKVTLDIIKKSSKQFHAVKKQLNRKDVTEIIIATDAGREGELVARWIIEKAHCHKPMKRLWISSVTDKAIKDGFKDLRNGKNYDNLYYSALGRAEADWLVGINASRALTCKYNAQLSCGRVQTPTLNLIATREKEIKNFVPKNYWEIQLIANNSSFLWKDQKTNESRIFDESKLKNLLKKLRGQTQSKVIKVDTKEKLSYAPLLYDLTELQRDANRLFDFSAKETLSIAQRLYENHKVLTYPRTDSRYLTTDIVPTLVERLDAIKVQAYSSFIRQIPRPIKGSKHFVDNSKVSDHHAIIPTEEKLIPSNLSDSERKIFDLVAKRFLSVLYPPYKYEELRIELEVCGESFVATGKHPIQLGWKEVYAKDKTIEENKEESLSPLVENSFIDIKSIHEVKRQTSPPPLFNEATLLSAMENPAKYMDQKNSTLAKVLGETGGLGTVATRADIIEKIFNKFYVERKGKDIITTSKGRQLLDLVPEDLKSPDLTGTWELKLDAIKNGKETKEKFIDDIKSYTKNIIEEIKGDTGKFIHDNITGEKCPNCGKNMLEQKDKVGTVLVCMDRECGARKRISKSTNARCPQCQKKLTLQGQGEGQIFTCKCGYREKLSSFNKRKNSEKKGITKKEAQKYLKKNSETQAEVNTALADALAKLKL